MTTQMNHFLVGMSPAMPGAPPIKEVHHQQDRQDEALLGEVDAWGHRH